MNSPSGRTGGLATVGERLRAVRAQLGKNQEEMAAAARIPIDTYRKYEGDARVPGGDALGGIGLLGVDLTWLLTGRGGDTLALARAHGTQLAQEMHARYDATEAIALLPFYDVRAAAGHGALVEDRPPSEHRAFSRAWLARHVGVSTSRLMIITVAGNSMEPDLHDGDEVMIDTGDTEVVREGIYVFGLSGHIYVKRLALHGDTLAIVSDNAAEYPARHINTLRENSTFRLIGRVLGQPRFRRL